MPRKLFKRWSPDPSQIKRLPGLGFMGAVLHDPNLFHFNRHSVAKAVFLGVFLAFLPIPGQVPLAAVGALLIHCNLPIAIALVWITNPFTFAFIFYACYKLGLWILERQPEIVHFELSWNWVGNHLLPNWQPLLLGCFISALFLSCSAYLAVQWTWRWHIVKKLQARRLKRALSASTQ